MINRRQLLKGSVAGATGLAVSEWTQRPAHAIDYAESVPEAAGLTTYQKDSNVLIRFNNLPVMGYRAQPSLKYPYFCPLNGPVSGLSLTTESALPYPHHRGLWLGCDPVNGGNYWADNGLESGQIRSVELALDSDVKTEHTVRFTQKCVWSREGSHPLDDERRYTVTIAAGRHVLLDCRFKLTAVEDVSIKRAKHSFFAMRAAPDISPNYGGTMINSIGDINAAGTYGKVADWCGYFGKRKLRPDVVEGIVIMNHPENFGGNCPWFTRDYGHLSPSPFNFIDEPWTIEKDETLELKYRVVLFAGTPKEAGLDGIFKSWLES